MNAYLTDAKLLHFVGIKGVAMTALALWAKEAGYTVSGSDVAEKFPTDEMLARKEIIPSIGFSPDHLTPRPDVVIYTGAHGGRDNPEVQEAIALGIPVSPQGKALGEVMKGKRQISVAGSHGKTTTSAMIATMLSKSNTDPSYAIGCGEIFGLGLPGHSGSGEFFVAEADEYITEPGHDRTPRFLWQQPEILVVPNIDFDHPDAYASIEDVQSAFLALKSQMQGDSVTIYNAEDHLSNVLAGHGKTYTFGLTEQADFHITDVRVGNEETLFSLSRDGSRVGEFSLRVPGMHNVLNATAALVACSVTGLSWETLASALPHFRGTKRRFEYVGAFEGMKVYDDYAHHPKEIQATLQAVRQWYPDRHLTAVFQPHTYSRTKALLSEFGTAFGEADTVLLADIYASAREHDTLGISTTAVVDEVRKHHAHVVSAPGFAEIKAFLSQNINAQGIVVFMGAGDIYGWSRALIGGTTV